MGALHFSPDGAIGEMTRLTLEDVGHLAGVSRSTVSRVINKESSVSAAVRQRVEDVIRQTGYTPNAAARSLVSNRTGVIGLVIPSGVHNLFEDPYFARLIQGVTTASNRAHATLSLFLFETQDEEKDIYPRVVESGFLDGVIVTATRSGDPLISRIAASSLPTVIVGRPGIEGVSFVDVDNKGGSRDAARLLCETGCQVVGCIRAPESTTTGQDRLAGFIEGLADGGRALPTRRIADGDYSESSGYDGMIQLLNEGVDGVFVASDTMALGALRAIRESGLRVPDDVAVVGFDGFSASESANPPLTTLRQPVVQTAAGAVEMLMAEIERQGGEAVSRVLPVELVIRESTRPAPSSHSSESA